MKPISCFLLTSSSFNCLQKADQIQLRNLAMQVRSFDLFTALLFNPLTFHCLTFHTEGQRWIPSIDSNSRHPPHFVCYVCNFFFSRREIPLKSARFIHCIINQRYNTIKTNSVTIVQYPKKKGRCSSAKTRLFILFTSLSFLFTV
jgi:hypothetical protein